MNNLMKVSTLLLLAAGSGIHAEGAGMFEVGGHEALTPRVTAEPWARERITTEENLAHENALRRSALVYGDNDSLTPEDREFIKTGLNPSEVQLLNRYDTKKKYQQDVAYTQELEQLSSEQRIAIVKAYEEERAVRAIRNMYTPEELRAQESEQRSIDTAREYGYEVDTMTAKEKRLMLEAAARREAAAKVDAAARQKYPELYQEMIERNY